MITFRSIASFFAIALAISNVSSAQVFVRNSTNVPHQLGAGGRYTENIDFADVDLDGDWDAALARGGDLGNLQDQLWINQGGLQGGTLGNFVDGTASRMPTVARDGRDIEFVDFDNDGDPDLYISNTSTVTNQICQWFTNQGGNQPGVPGFYVDMTPTRWMNVGVASTGSSIPASQVITGGFISWSGDGDFADIDNDGDMDLVHSSYGSAMSGNVPSRIFLNDGRGHFEEFNPSGIHLSGANITDGTAGLWCEGIQTTDTSNTTGTNCDIASNGQDVDFGDVDGDFDLDLLHGNLTGETRFFVNRLEENGGASNQLSFRDETHSIFPANWSLGEGQYEQEMGDFDGDNDLDLFGLSWQTVGASINDVLLENTGGSFGPPLSFPNVGSFSNESDFGDYDNDGDLDLYVANFTGGDSLYANNGSGTYTLLPNDNTGSGLDAHGLVSVLSTDVDWCDVDGDGDYDVFVGQDTNKPVLYWQNQTNVTDNTAPRVAPTEQIGNQTAGTTSVKDFPVRTHIYDNAAYYTTAYNDTNLIVEVDGIEIDTIPASYAGGQVFRAELPANLVGQVTYRIESSDKYGNTGVSVDNSYVASTGLTLENTYGSGTVGATGQLHEIHVRGLATADKNLYLSIETNATPTIYIMVIASASIAPTPITDLGILNIDPTKIIVQKLGVTNASGIHVRKIPLSLSVPSGFSVFAQIFGFDGIGGDIYSSSEGLEIPFH